MRYVDLRSDTVTQPTPAMRRAMAEAVVGDDVYGDDPTMNELEKTAAELLNKEAALFVTSGTMGNQLAVMSRTNRGDEVIVSAESHIFEHEVGAAAVLSGANLRTVPFPKGIFDAALIEAAIREEDIHHPKTALICVENALSNGRVVPLSVLQDVYAMARRRGIPVHMDGARLFNAAVSLGVPAPALAACCDSVMFCLSKGLCAPVGSILAGERAFIDRARKNRKLLGGGMRQAGFLAAAGLVALRDMTGRLAEDHENARYLAGRLAEIPGVTIDWDALQINMVWCDVDRPRAALDSLQARMLEKGIKIGSFLNGRMRLVTNNDVTKEDIDRAVTALADVLGK